MHSFLVLSFLIPSLTAVGFYGAALCAAWDFFSGRSRPSPPEPEFTPPVSLLKPVHGLDPSSYENLSSFCRQDYPDMQILFGVRDEKEPVVEILRRIVRDSPDLDVQIVSCPSAEGANPKVSSLIQMEKQARHPFLLVCDADIRVGREYLRRVIRPMRGPEVGAVTCMCRSLSKGVIATLEALRESTEFCPFVLTAWRWEGMKFALGSTVLIRREILREIGGFRSIADYLADDFLLGNRIARAGYRVILSDLVVEHDFSATGLKALIRRQIRWNRGIRACRPWGYRGLIFTYGIPMSGALLLISGAAPWAWAVLGLTWLTRLLTAYSIGALHLKDRAAQRFWIWVPVQDILSFVLWCFGLFGSVVYWRGKTFRLLKDGRLVSPDPPSPEELPQEPTNHVSPIAVAR
ncbi:MAG: bacteriohopanetetrol glucosamine biosynthesis glycosyltransferase HpnI [Candidatus Omnitrophica bacterium]|nr:bacteriohopanetetrol glucosamine biosynthesis glycosyltransferase HpnI [Candidatus Omnitrophota bacterium]